MTQRYEITGFEDLNRKLCMLIVNDVNSKKYILNLRKKYITLQFSNEISTLLKTTGEKQKVLYIFLPIDNIITVT